MGVPVFPHDITDRPYDVIGEVTAGVRKATIFSKEASQEKIYKELWERADKLGADAVVNASYGDSHVSAFSWGKTNAKGTAIKFRAAPVAAAPVSEGQQPAPHNRGRRPTIPSPAATSSHAGFAMLIAAGAYRRRRPGVSHERHHVRLVPSAPFARCRSRASKLPAQRHGQPISAQ